MSHVTLAGVLHLWRSDGARALTLAAALALLAACGAGNSPEDVARVGEDRAQALRRPLGG